MGETASNNTISLYHREYKVLRQIAAGAFGSVHCVQRHDTKVIHAAKYVKSKTVDLEREVKALRELSGKSSLVLKFVSFYHNTNGVQAVLVTEFLGGGDLCERTSSKDYVLTEQKCRNIVRQICRGVDYIHSNNYLHLDLKPFNIVFVQKKDDYNLKIIDFGLAREMDETRRVRVGMCGTVEYMSPEVMNEAEATPASDCWGIGVIAYQLLSGGVSPFFAVNRFRTMARVIECDYSFEQCELRKATDQAKDFISQLLVKSPENRMTADQCLQHPWLVDDKLYLGILETLETTWMRRCLARRRWYRLLNAVRVMNSIRQLSTGTSWESNNSNAVSSDDDGDVVVHTPPKSSSRPRMNNGLHSNSRSSLEEDGGGSNFPVFEFTDYEDTFEKLHLIMNNGMFGTLFCVQHTVTGEVFTAKHVRADQHSARREAAILHRVRNEPTVIGLYALFAAPRSSVIVTDFVVGGDLVERTARTDFVLNESKCKNYVRQICEGLGHIHACGVVHLDLKPFSIVFTTRDDDAVLKITDFGLARWQPKDGALKVSQMCGSLEFISPEVLECTEATTATDCWGVGVIAFMLITGGRSPFYGGNRFRTMAKILTAQFEDNFTQSAAHVSNEAMGFIRELLLLDPTFRMTAAECLKHPWLTSDDCGDVLKTLETSWMKQVLARRRWHRWFHAVRAMQRIRKLSAAGKGRRAAARRNGQTPKVAV